MSSQYKPYLNQSYAEIKQRCLQSKRLFEDDKFPAAKSSMGRFRVEKSVEWRRPREFVNNPQFIVNTIEPNDIDQGILGDWWV